MLKGVSCKIYFKANTRQLTLKFIRLVSQDFRGGNMTSESVCNHEIKLAGSSL